MITDSAPGLIGAVEVTFAHSLRQRCVIHRCRNLLAKVPKHARRWGDRYPAAVACLTDTLPELTCFLRFPHEHWARIRHTNLIERTFGETKRRTKVIGRLPGERSCLSLVWAVLDRAPRGWRGVIMTPAGVRRLQELRRQLHHPSRLEEVADQPVSPAA